MRLGVLLALAASGAAQDPSLDRAPAEGPSWKSVFFHDEDGSSVAFSDIHFSGVDCAVAFGSRHETKSGAVGGVAVRSIDGGTRWETVALAEVPRSGFLLAGGRGWMVTPAGVWRTKDCAKNWERVSGQQGLVRVYFVDENRGYGAGVGKQALETRDGGKSWTKLPALAEIGSDAERSYFQWLDFAGRFGMIVGAHEPRRPADSLARRRQLPSLLLTLQTIDGGETWKGASASILGQVTKVRLARDGTGLAVVEFRDMFEWPAEVYRLDPRGNAMTRVFREADRAVKDALTQAGGISYIAAIEPPGRDWRLPSPGKVRIARSEDQLHWREMRVDYRAVASSVSLAAVPGGPVLAAAGNGMILRLTAE